MEIDIKQLEKIIDSRNSLFLCGNGFSINFDSDFGNIYDRLYQSHKELIHNSVYQVKANHIFTKKCKDNYNSVKQYLRNISEAELHLIFSDGLIFAESINGDNQLIQEMWEKKIITRLTFGLNHLDIVKLICNVGKAKGVKYVNIEHWTILIYFYFGIKKLNPNYYSFPEDNSFVTCINVGDVSAIKLVEDAGIYEDVIFNGLNTYYRMLFSIAIFSQAKAIKFDKLDKLQHLDISRIKQFLTKFKVLLTLNYDHIIENIISNNVEHLHGEFIINKVEYVYHQSYRLNYSDGFVSFADILLGDYFVYKAFIPAVNVMANNEINKPLVHVIKKIDRIIKDNNISNLVIFGMSINNDQHVLRNITIALYHAKIDKPKIIYCYYTPEELEEFINQYQAVITYGEDLNKYVRSIDLYCLKTQDILEQYFHL